MGGRIVSPTGSFADLTNVERCVYNGVVDGGSATTEEKVRHEVNLIPLPGRDYKSKAEVLEAWNSDKDFHTADIMSGYGLATKKSELVHLGNKLIQVRYKNLTNVVLVSPLSNKAQ